MGEDLLPEGWVETTFGEIFDFKGGSQPPKKEFSNEPTDGYVRLLQIRDFSSDKYPVYIKDEKRWPKCKADDVMIARYGASVGRVLTGMEGAYNVALVKMIFDRELIDPKWARYFFMTRAFQDPIHLLSRSAQNGFNKKELAPIKVLLPPPAQQKRIVKKIESLQQRSRKARQALEAVKPLLAQFRQSVLKAAFSGELTREWRENNPDVEPASELLARIRKERRQKWEQAELAKYEAKGKKPPKNWQDKYKEPAPVDTSNLPALPEGWAWETLGNLAEIQSGVTLGSKKKKEQSYVTVPYLRVANVQRGYLNLEDVKEVEVTSEKAEALLLKIGDVLFNEGGDRDKLGRGWVWNNEIDGCIHQNHVFRARLYGGFVPELLSHYANEFGRDYFFLNASQSVNLASINKTQLSGLPVPVLPKREQHALLEEIHNSFGLLESIDSYVNASLHISHELQQSILETAFKGDLVS